MGKLMQNDIHFTSLTNPEGASLLLDGPVGDRHWVLPFASNYDYTNWMNCAASDRALRKFTINDETIADTHSPISSVVRINYNPVK